MRVEATPIAAMPEGNGRGADPSRMKAAGEDFEALIVAQMLRSARQEGSMTSLDADSAGSDDTITDFAEQQFSKALTSAGGLGLAKLVVSGLNRATGSHVLSPLSTSR